MLWTKRTHIPGEMQKLFEMSNGNGTDNDRKKKIWRGW